MSEDQNLPDISDASLDRDAPADVRAKALRDYFIAEYLVDFDQNAAAQRIGFQRVFAIQYAQKLMAEPYVARRIKEIQFERTDAKADEEFNKARIKAALLREAHNYGPGSSHSARVQALTALQRQYGMEQPKKTEVAVKHQGGVMRVPGIASMEDWENAAVTSQTKLVSDARS